MPDTAVVWFRRDLRVARPARARARLPRARARRAALRLRSRLAGRALPLARPHGVDARLPRGARRRAARPRRAAGAAPRPPGDRGAPRRRARPARATVHVSDDVTGFARARDARVEAALGRDGVQLRPPPGPLRGRPAGDRAPPGRPVQGLHALPARLARPGAPARPSARRARSRWRRSPRARLPSLRALGFEGRAPRLQDRPEPGAAAARRAAERWLRSAAPERYAERRDVLAEPTSRLSAYLRFGCLSALSLERARGRARRCSATATSSPGATSSPPCSCTSPRRARVELDARYRTLEWDRDPALVAPGARARTGFPVVDAAMRQLAATGWMHNRARMIVGSFLTKDLQQDWREGERHFMAHLLDGDVASNNGGWQWIASTGTDPAPVLPAPLQSDDPAAPLRPRRALRAPLVPGAAPACPTTGSPSRGR